MLPLPLYLVCEGGQTNKIRYGGCNIASNLVHPDQFLGGTKFFMTGFIVIMLAYGRRILRKNIPFAHAEELNEKNVVAHEIV